MVYNHFQLFLPLRYTFDNIDIKTIEEKYIFLKQKSLLMTDYLPFANDYGANQICVNLDNGRIYIVYMDVGEIEQKSFKYLTSGFSEFVRGLSAESIE